MPKLYVLHAAFVHFPIALLLTGLAGGVADRVSGGKRGWLADAVSWLLWLGTASAWAAMGLGLFAEKTAPHVPPAWETLADHKALAFWTVGVFSALSLWRKFFKDRGSRLFIAAWLACAGALLATAYLGGELVFTYNMGTNASEP
ncbi:MAG: DUF2231 domain-containing protein [Elusimicrobia bacterium]|nr:DUF2231 domain-containing protein [Elusimicrobiota bacterium]